MAETDKKDRQARQKQTKMPLRFQAMTVAGEAGQNIICWIFIERFHSLASLFTQH